MNYIIILGVFQAFVSLSLFMVYKRKRPAENILTLILLCIFTHLSLKFFIYAFSDISLFKLGFNTFTDLAYAPLLWMYASKVKNKRLKSKYVAVLVPSLTAGFFYIYILFCGISNQESYKDIIIRYNTITNQLIPLSFIVFPLLSIYKSQSIENFWRAEKELIRWISCVFLLMGAISLVLNVGGSVNLIKVDSLIYPVRVFSYSLMLLISLLILRYKLIYLIQQSSSLTQYANSLQVQLIEPEENNPPVPEYDEEPFVKKFVLDEERRIAIAEQIRSLMQSKKVYADAELSLEKLSKLSNIPRHHLSEVFNHHLGKSFYLVLNEYRVKEVIRLLDEYKKRRITPNILVIAFEAGFNSKSTFNQYFRKTTGITPSEYLKKEDRDRFSTGNTPAFSV